MQYVAMPTGPGLRKHRSHDVVPVDDCLIEAPNARRVLVEEGARPGGRAASLRADSRDHSRSEGQLVVESVRGRDFRVAADGFWQVHPQAPTVLVEAVLDLVAPRPGERVLDLYAGVGLFSAFLAEAVGPGGAVLSVEADRQASALAEDNLADLPQAEVRPGRVDRVLATGFGHGVDIVVLDPPREGAKRKVVETIAALRPRAVGYVACDPAALARDVAYFAAAGYDLAGLRAFDLFPMTSHVECVALLERAWPDLRRSDSR